MNDVNFLSEKLIDLIESKKNDFEPVTQHTPYFHMGATITDAILQAGLNYRYVVYPRILKLLTNYKEFTTTSDFLILMQAIPLNKLIDWNHDLKLNRIRDLCWFFYSNKIENENELSIWLNNSSNIYSIKSIKGIGPKTIDYLKMLSGNQAIPIDRHLFKFLELAGIFIKNYAEASSIFSRAAQELNISKYELDRKIWAYMSSPKL